MTDQESMQALISEENVEYDGIIYRRVEEVVHKRRSGKITTSVGLLDKNGNSIIYASAEKVHKIREEIERTA